jgi:hypothetical protein
MHNSKRHGKRWSINEVLALEREYELLNLSIKDISKKHQRSVDSIMFKLQSEGLMPLSSNNIQLEEEEYSDNDSSSDYQEEEDEEDEDEEEDEEDEEDDTGTHSSMPSLISIHDNDEDSQYSKNNCLECSVDTLSDRIWNLETSLGEISTMVKQIFDKISTEKKSKKLAPLRQYWSSKF